MTVPRMYLLLIASVAGVQLFLRIGRPYKALKDRDTTCTCCSEYAQKQENVNGWRERMGGAEWYETEGLAASLLRGILDFLGCASASFLRCRSYYQFM